MESKKTNSAVYTFKEVAGRIGQTPARLLGLIHSGIIRAQMNSNPYNHMDFSITEEALNGYLKEEKSRAINELEKSIEADKGRLQALRADLAELG